MKQDALILCAAAAILPLVRSTACGLPVCVSLYWKQSTRQRSGGRSRFVRQSMKVKQPWKVCVLCALKRWRRQKRSGTRMRFLFW